MIEVDYSYYTNIYMGHLIPSMEFNRVLQQAEQVLRWVIRGAKPEDLDEEKVSRVLCELGDKLYTHEGQSGLLRESLDGYDVTYEKESFGKELVMIIRRYFGDEGILYRGRH